RDCQVSCFDSIQTSHAPTARATRAVAPSAATSIHLDRPRTPETVLRAAPNPVTIKRRKRTAPRTRIPLVSGDGHALAMGASRDEGGERPRRHRRTTAGGAGE